MSDRLARKLGLSDTEIADLDRLCALMSGPPQPPDGGPEDDDTPPLAAGRGLVIGCAIGLLIAIALALWVEITLVLA